MDSIKIGVIIADDMEYAPITEMGGEYKPYFGKNGHLLTFSEYGKTIEVYAVHCGVGKVNAAAAAMHLIDGGCSMLLNTGLSGGIKGVRRGDLAIGTSFVEHDFDLTPLGYKKGVKPSQEYVYSADKRLVSHFSALCPHAVSGPMVTGDCFVSDAATRDELISEYGAVCCDMETAAIASVCSSAGVPFFTIRRVSDDAGDDAGTSYRDMNENEKFDLAVLLFRGIKEMLYSNTLFC